MTGHHKKTLTIVETTETKDRRGRKPGRNAQILNSNKVRSRTSVQLKSHLRQISQNNVIYINVTTTTLMNAST